VVILLSKYLSRANENKKSENVEINKEGIRVNNEKNIIYFLLAIDPLTLILFLNEFFTSMNIIKKKITNKIESAINKFCKFFSFKGIKLLSINVKNVMKPIERVKINTIVINRFLFKKVNIG
tara:strand:- start:153 stop:518 length:366 start_codon:yes stop_codon:yes gene_type:complete